MTDTDELYQEQLLEEYSHPQNWGLLAKSTHQAEYGNASCGDVITVSLELDEAGLIKRVGWEGQGCAVSLAGMSVLSKAIIGQDGNQVMSWQYQDVGKLLGLDNISPSRVACLQTGLKAVQQALNSSQR